jgi:hypothetical protein
MRYALILLSLIASLSTNAQIVLNGATINGATIGTTNATSGGGGGDTVLVTSQDTTNPSQRNDVTGTLGFQFTVGAANITVTSLGRWVIAGNSQTHLIVITSSDCLTTIASGTVNCSGATAGDYVYTSITPVTLTAGTTYRLMSTEVTGLDLWYNNGVITTTGAVNTVSLAYNIGGNCINASSDESFIPVNLKYHL